MLKAKAQRLIQKPPTVTFSGSILKGKGKQYVLPEFGQDLTVPGLRARGARQERLQGVVAWDPL